MELKRKVYGDASAALGIINRIGLGKTRHIDTSLLWIQLIAAARRLEFHKVLGKNNPGDLYTKYLDVATSDAHVKTLQYEFATGRAQEAPKLHILSRPYTQYVTRMELKAWEWLQTITGARKNKTVECKGEAHAVTTSGRVTDSGPRVL